MPGIPPLRPHEREHYEALIWGAELGTAIELDLHGEPADEALLTLDRFVHQELMQRTEIIRIIYGRGTGTLRQAILRWLKNNRKLIPYFRESTNLSEAGAVAYACLTKLGRRHFG